VEKSVSQWKSIASMSLLVLVLFAAVTATFILYTRRKREQEYRQQVAMVTGLRMEIVRNRVSPHFVFNALNVMMPSLDQHRELERPFRLLIQMLRNNLRASEQVAVPLEEEIDLVKNFLLLNEIGDSQKITVDWQVADDVPVDARIPSMSIQIPVENAVKYAFTAEQDDARIDVCIKRMDNVICIVIDDNGVGFQPGAAGALSERGTGSGLKMLRRTVELLNTRNQYQMAFTIENKNSFGNGTHGTRVSVVVPLEYQFEMT
jgi:LytS/YehU family sensor histidine kinase